MKVMKKYTVLLLIASILLSSTHIPTFADDNSGSSGSGGSGGTQTARSYLFKEKFTP